MNDNKLLLRIAGLIAYIFGIICCITIVGLIVGIPLIIGGKKFQEIYDKQSYPSKEDKDTILIWSIVFLFLCQLSGILGLVYYFLALDIKVVTSTKKEDKYDRLEKLKKLYDEKAISKEEFEKEKAKIFNEE